MSIETDEKGKGRSGAEPKHTNKVANTKEDAETINGTAMATMLLLLLIVDVDVGAIKKHEDSSNDHRSSLAQSVSFIAPSLQGGKRRPPLIPPANCADRGSLPPFVYGVVILLTSYGRASIR